MNKLNRIVIVIEGGCLRDVIADQAVQVILIDRDEIKAGGNGVDYSYPVELDTVDEVLAAAPPEEVQP